MSLPNKVAKIRFIYHTNMLDVCNVLNQVGILKDEKAEEVMKNHGMNAIDCVARLNDMTIDELLNTEKKES